jgi:hypothetical protein
MVTSAVFDAAAAARQVVAALLPQADSERAGQARRYLNSDLDFLGVSVPAIRWHVPSPAAMNARAAALGPQLNIFSADGAVAATPPAFLSYSPARYLRPFNLFP